MSNLDAEHFDTWYADMRRTEELERAKQRLLGLPDTVSTTSMVSMGALREITGWLALDRDSVLLDLACSRGGYGLWIARETGCSLIGVDFSAVALEDAQRSADALGLADRSRFALGTLTACGLPDESVDAVTILDAFQFAAGPSIAAECRRVLRPGGRLVATCWESAVPGDEQVLGRIREVDLRGSLSAGGFADVAVTERPDWRAVERAYWEAAVQVEPADDPAVQSWVGEGRRSLAEWDRLRRIVATARQP